MRNFPNDREILIKKLNVIQRRAIKDGLNCVILKEFNVYNQSVNKYVLKRRDKRVIGFLTTFVISVAVSCSTINNILSSRCLLPNNYIIWEATRPLANCSYCSNITKPIILWNVSRKDFSSYAYASRPIIVKKAINHWKATQELSFKLLKRLYEQTAGSYDSFEEGCQFLNFKTDLFSLKEVFNMPEARQRNEPGQKPWYVGWGNCHPDILSKVREYYSIPEFLPEDAEFPSTENIFFGYETGAVMHLDYIPRLMWQGQVQGNKTWSIAPVTECDHVCNKFQYYVEPGDIVLLDTRLWYHATRIPKGQFSLTVQSEYG